MKRKRDYQHQTGHNSGVIHAGVYYAPGSLKAKFCKAGLEATIAFCKKHDIEVENCGKLLVATNPVELERMDALLQRCAENGIDVKRLSQQELRETEPNIVGIGALLVHTTSIVNYRKVTEKMAEEFTALGGEILMKTCVTALSENEDAVTATCLGDGLEYQVSAKFLITCSGLMADRTTKMLGIKTDFQIIPYRGEYYRLPEKYNKIVNHLIYPIPDPELPFLGVHLTRMIDGSVTVGPNAVQGWKREGYGKYNFSFKDTVEMLLFGGFWKVTRKHLKSGLRETLNSWWKPGYLKQVNKYCPKIKLEDLQPYPAGIRAQAVLKDGTLFMISCLQTVPVAFTFAMRLHRLQHPPCLSESTFARRWWKSKVWFLQSRKMLLRLSSKSPSTNIVIERSRGDGSTITRFFSPSYTLIPTRQRWI